MGVEELLSIASAANILINPVDVLVGLNGKIYVTVFEGYYIIVLNSDGTFYKKAGGFSTTDPAKFSSIGSIAQDSAGNIYVTDPYGDKVNKYDSELVHISSFGSTGTADGQLDNPTDIYIDASNNIFVVDEANDRIQKFDTTGAYVSKFGGFGSADGLFNSPTAMAADSTGNLFVLDWLNFRVQKFTSAGVFISKFGSNGVADGQIGGAAGIAIDSSDNIFISRNVLSAYDVQKFDSAGVFVSKLVGALNRNEQFFGTSSLYIEPVSNELLVVQNGAHIIQRYTTNNFTLVRNYGGTPAPNEFLVPGNITFTSTGEMIVVDTKFNLFKKFDVSLNHVGTYGFPGVLADAYPSTHYKTQVGVDSTGNIYFWSASKAHKISPSGALLWSIGFSAPQGLAVYNDNLYLLNSGSVSKYDTSGAFISSFSVSGQTSVSNYMAIDSSGNFYIADLWNYKIMKFNPAGAFVLSWGGIGYSTNGKFSNIYGITTDRNGNVLVQEGSNRIQSFTPLGVHAKTIGGYGSSHDTFMSLNGIAVSPIDGTLYTSNKSQIKWIPEGGY